MSHARVTPRLSSASLTNTRTTTVPPLRPPTAVSTSRPPAAVSAVKLLPCCASSTARDRGAGSPSTVAPSGRNTLAGRPSALISWPTLALRLVADGELATIALICCASLVAAVMARSAASTRSTTASGTTNAISTSAMVADTSSASRRRISQSPPAPTRTRAPGRTPPSDAAPASGAASRTPTRRTVCR